MKKILKKTGFTLLTLVSFSVLVLLGVGFVSLFFGATSLLAPVLSAAPILAPILGSYLLTGLGGIIGLVSGIFFVRKTIEAFNNEEIKPEQKEEKKEIKNEIGEHGNLEQPKKQNIKIKMKPLNKIEQLLGNPTDLLKSKTVSFEVDKEDKGGEKNNENNNNQHVLLTF